MSQAIHLDIISFRVPADPNMFITIGSDDVLFIVGKKERIKWGCVAKDQLPSRWVFMRRKCISLLFYSKRNIDEWVAIFPNELGGK